MRHSRFGRHQIRHCAWVTMQQRHSTPLFSRLRQPRLCNPSSYLSRRNLVCMLLLHFHSLQRCQVMRALDRAAASPAELKSAKHLHSEASSCLLQFLFGSVDATKKKDLPSVQLLLVWPIASKRAASFSDETQWTGDWTLGCFRAADPRRIGCIDGEDDGCCDICFNRFDDSASSPLEFGAFALAVPLERDVAQRGQESDGGRVEASAAVFQADSCSTGRGCSRGTEAAQRGESAASVAAWRSRGDGVNDSPVLEKGGRRSGHGTAKGSDVARGGADVILIDFYSIRVTGFRAKNNFAPHETLSGLHLTFGAVPHSFLTLAFDFASALPRAPRFPCQCHRPLRRLCTAPGHFLMLLQRRKRRENCILDSAGCNSNVCMHPAAASLLIRSREAASRMRPSDESECSDLQSLGQRSNSSLAKQTAEDREERTGSSSRINANAKRFASHALFEFCSFPSAAPFA